MNLPLAERSLASDLLELFELDFRRWLERGVSHPHGGEYERLWERALAEPARSMLERPGKLFRARLACSAHALAGGNPDALASELPLAVEVLHLGSLIVDDVQDGSRRRRGAAALHELVGAPLAINTGNLFYCWTLDLLSRAGLPPERELELLRRTASAMLRCHQGQALDLSVRVHETAACDLPTVVQTSTRLKSGSLLELAAALGAVAAGAPRGRIESLCSFGSELGVGLQMLDDLSGVLNERRREKGLEDLRLGRATWVWAWLARDLDPPSFASLQREAGLALDGADPGPLLERLREELASRGPERVHDHLATTLESLVEHLGPSAESTALRQEIDRLERSYV